MPDITSNDNEHVASAAVGADAHGQAAMLVVESLLHNLMARDVIGIGDAVELVGVAVEVATELEETPARPMSSLTILAALHTTLSRDLP